MASITLNKNNFFNNLDIISNKSKTKDKIAIVLKDNAYGHGLLEMAQLSYEYGITKCVVQNSSEAYLVEKFFDYILVLADFPSVYSEKIRYAINDINAIEKFPENTKVELKVDTGMHRNGVGISELESAFEKIQKSSLLLEAVFTHHRSADELTGEWFWQNDNFQKVKTLSLQLAQKYNFEHLRFHSANSASLLRTQNFDEDMARVGIGVYGCIDLPDALKVDGLKPVLSLYASKISSRVLQKGEKIGYGATYESSEDIIVSNYNIGYGDGFLRSLSNNYKTPQGVQIAGRVSMDNSSFVSADEELLIFNDARSVAKSAQTISYEILTSLKPSLKRRVI